MRAVGAPHRPTRDLPAGYREWARLDLNKDMGAQVGLSIAGLVLLLVFGWLFLVAAAALRGSDESLGFTASGAGWLAALTVLLAVMAAVVVLHEAVHGLFFWLFTGDRPTFGFKGMYAYAAAPEWYLPRWPYAVVGIAPLLVLTLLGLALLPAVPAAAVTPLVAAMTLNAAGAVGDLLVVGWLLVVPRRALVNDTGDVFTVYAPGG